MAIHKKTVEARWYLGCNKAVSKADTVELQPYVPLRAGKSESGSSVDCLFVSHGWGKSIEVRSGNSNGNKIWFETIVGDTVRNW